MLNNVNFLLDFDNADKKYDYIMAIWTDLISTINEQTINQHFKALSRSKLPCKI